MTLELIGLIGALAFLLGFFEVSVGKWDGRSRRFEALNLFGAILMGYYTLQKHAYMNIVLNVVWGVVALYAIFHVAKRHKVRKRLRAKPSQAKNKKPRKT